jgi:hypothetical protein
MKITEALCLRPRITERLVGVVMGRIALHTPGVTQRALAWEIGVTQPTVSTVMQKLRKADWRQDAAKDEVRDRTGPKANLVAPTPEFYEALQVAINVADGLGHPYNTLYYQTVAAARERSKDMPDLAALQTQARVLGGIAVLGGYAELDILTGGDWLPGPAGWDLLVRTRAAMKF